MDSAGNTVSYCCVSKRGRLLYKYNNCGGGGGGGGGEIDKLAASCLEVTPRYHSWYFETTGKYTFGFLMDDDDGLVYFTIVCKSLGNSLLLRFLQKLRDEFGRIAVTTSLANNELQEQLFPAVLGLVASLEQWPLATPSNINIVVDEAPLLGNKKMNKDQAVMAIETEEHNRRCDRGSSSGSSSQKNKMEEHNRRSDRGNSSGGSSQKNKWCCRVRIVLAIDAAVCTLLFIIWLIICHGIQCIS